MDRLTALAAATLAAGSAVPTVGASARGGPPPIPGAIVTSVQVRRAGPLAATLRACRGRGPREWTPRTVVVDRRNGFRRTLVFRTSDGRSLASCDSIGVRIEGRLWCGVSSGMLYRGRLRDPRLTLCQPRSGRPVAFAWVTPRPRARWIGLLQGSRTELYRVVAGLPVRVASERNVHVSGSSATFFVRQYSATGAVLARQTIVARVAG
jgi:hypothetical protein